MLMTLVRFAMTETTLVEMVALKDVSSFNALSSVLLLENHYPLRQRYF